MPKAALGTPVEGYVMPMFNSQTAVAYNPDVVKSPPSTYDELVEWTKKNPKQFGYNGIKGGMSGVSFVMGWMYAYGPDAEKLENGPFDPELTKSKGWTRRHEQAEGVQQERHLHARQCRHTRHAQPRRDRHGAGLGGHVLYLEGGRAPATRP